MACIFYTPFLTDVTLTAVCCYGYTEAHVQIKLRITKVPKCLARSLHLYFSRTSHVLIYFCRVLISSQTCSNGGGNTKF